MSDTVISSSPFSVYSFVNVNLSCDNVQPSTSSISLFDLTTTFTFLLVGSVVLYSTSKTGASPSLTLTINCESAIAPPFIVIVASVAFSFNVIFVLSVLKVQFTNSGC